MSDHPHRARRSVARGTVSVAVVLALSGALFAANAKFAQASGGDRHPQDLDDLARVELGRVDSLTSEVDALHTDVDALAASANEATGTTVGTPSAGYLIESGSTEVTGPGLTVRLDDAPSDSPRRDDIAPDVLVVHQQDLQSVMNALWAGGAEAMALMDQRVISTSAFRCVGNVLRLHGLLYSPPYEVRAIGDPDALRAALDADPMVDAYQRDASEVGLGWDVSSGSLDLPAYAGATELTSASVPKGTPILPGLPAAGDPSPALDAPATTSTPDERTR
ncbi:DUF881 domain-containing protein [Cellulomonas sp. PhB150]|uniref:DUF881 domain-containing protein n=1 Tax=Cellulomonas sp. PhB150 TaxID=2485188 RepID=UPI000F460C28|nr:DUF881 domain-containing protein [Cellulomonas sp. PhB150]ROS26211.1 uncharacterized protein YlxW (UPF0749 family) [Cellulomonas sp. PhB150]